MIKSLIGAACGIMLLTSAAAAEEFYAAEFDEEIEEVEDDTFPNFYKCHYRVDPAKIFDEVGRLTDKCNAEVRALGIELYEHTGIEIDRYEDKTYLTIVIDFA